MLSVPAVISQSASVLRFLFPPLSLFLESEVPYESSCFLIHMRLNIVLDGLEPDQSNKRMMQHEISIVAFVFNFFSNFNVNLSKI
jgi:hypothetical protein